MQSETLGRYRITKELGRGAMGRVFLAHDPEIDRQVAIKTVQIFSALPGAEQDAARERFLREARTAGKLLHPGIVTLFDVGEAEGVPYLAMEYVEGTTLDAFCKAGNLLPVKTVVEIVANVAEALDFAHRSGIIHRDIKPANLMRLVETSVKIMDFGLARGAESQITQDQALFGTPSYMSPEQIRGFELDGRSDLFSLAAVLYEMLTGQKAFGGDTISSILYRVVHEVPRDASEIDGRVPVNLSSFLTRALAKDRDERFSTGVDFAEALRAAGSSRSEVVESAEREEGRAAVLEDSLPPPPRRPGTRRSAAAAGVWAVVLVLLIAGAGAAGYVYREPLLAFIRPAPRSVWLETGVRTDPPGLPVTLDGEPLKAATVRFKSDGPFGVLSTSQDCRTETHRLDPADAGGEVVLVPDPVEVELTVDPGVPGAMVRVNDRDAVAAPASVALNLCSDNRVDVVADGYHDAQVALASGVTPLEARTRLGAVRLELIPRGRLVIPEAREVARFYVDGKPVRRSPDGVELTEGPHKLRAVNDRLWLDVTQTVSPNSEIPGE